jgi:hypothetical protein
MLNNNIFFQRTQSPLSGSGRNWSLSTTPELEFEFRSLYEELARRGVTPILTSGSNGTRGGHGGPQGGPPGVTPRGYIYSERTGKTYKQRKAQPKPAAIRNSERLLKVAKGNLTNYLNVFKVQKDDEILSYVCSNIMTRDQVARLESFSRLYALALAKLRLTRTGGYTPVDVWSVTCSDKQRPSEDTVLEFMGAAAKEFSDAVEQGSIVLPVVQKTELQTSPKRKSRALSRSLSPTKVGLLSKADSSPSRISPRRGVESKKGSTQPSTY